MVRPEVNLIQPEVIGFYRKLYSKKFLNGSFLRLVTTHFNCRLNDGLSPAGHLKSQVFPVQATVTPSLMFNALLFFGSPEFKIIIRHFTGQIGVK